METLEETNTSPDVRTLHNYSAFTHLQNYAPERGQCARSSTAHCKYARDGKTLSSCTSTVPGILRACACAYLFVFWILFSHICAQHPMMKLLKDGKPKEKHTLKVEKKLFSLVYRSNEFPTIYCLHDPWSYYFFVTLLTHTCTCTSAVGRWCKALTVRCALPSNILLKWRKCPLAFQGVWLDWYLANDRS